MEPSRLRGQDDLVSLNLALDIAWPGSEVHCCERGHSGKIMAELSMPESILCRSVALKQFLHGPAYLEARCIAHCHNYTVVTSYLMYLMALMSCAAHVHAQSEADINSSATQAVPVCVAGSGERAAYTPSLSKLATTVIDLGAVHCAPG